MMVVLYWAAIATAVAFTVGVWVLVGLLVSLIVRGEL